MNVLLEFDANARYGVLGEEDEDIIRQVLKLSEDNCNVPAQDVFAVLVVTEVGSIDSEKVTEIIELTETKVSLSEGDVDETTGEVVSEFVVWLSVVVWVSDEVEEVSSFVSCSEHDVKKKTRQRKRILKEGEGFEPNSFSLLQQFSFRP